MVEKRSETRANKQRLCRLSFHFALPIDDLCPSLLSLTQPMYVVRHGTVLRGLGPRESSAKSNYTLHVTRLRAHMN